MKVAIDGPAGSGKSSVAHAIAERRHFTFLDTGAMYRCVALKCLRDGVDLTDAAAVTAVAEASTIEFGKDEAGQTVILDGVDVTADIRTPEVDQNVSAAAAVPGVRTAMVARQRVLGEKGNVVAEGRDIGTVVFPNAEVKVFLTADPAARARRRAIQRHGGDAATGAAAAVDTAEEQQILADIVRRDKLDSSREESPLKPADDATHIDSSNLGFEEVVAQVMALMDAVDAGEKNAPQPAVAEAAPAEPKPTAKAEAAPAEPKPAAKPARKAPKSTPMRAFAGNTFDDYREHPMRDYPLPARALLGLIICVAGFFSKILWPWTIEDGHKLWDDKRGRVIVMNHVSMLEPVIVVASLWFHGIRIRPIYKSEFDKNAFVSWVFSRVGGIPVERGTADIKAVRRAERALRRGECVLIYPEGTRIKSDDEPVTIHGGFALMAQMGKAPVQPMAVVGARDITPKGKHLKRLGRVYVKCGDCIEFSQMDAKGRKAKIEQMEKVAMDTVYQLRDELRREHPGKM